MIEHPPRSIVGSAAEVLSRCAELDRFSAHPDHLERVYLTAEHAAANRQVAAWMTKAGLTPRQDAAGNQYGRREGREPGLPALLLGSHLDTVPDAGSYDGMLGVLMGVAVAERLGDQIAGFPFALEVVGFNDEEGTRFGKALLGSSAAAGIFQQDWWDLTDDDGLSLRSAFVDFGLDPDRIGDAARRPDELIGYLEAHIEQGPLLEAADASLGYVTTIAGARRFQVEIIGEARHAGGTPYDRRRDAMTGAAACILAVERLARASSGIATVGQLSAYPGAINVIAGRVEFSLDLRAATDPERDQLLELIQTEIEQLCTERRLGFTLTETHQAPAMPCAGWLTEAVVSGISATGDPSPLGMWSRAGHDGMAIGAVTDIAMMFLRCLDGISHHPAESVRAIDVERGLDALELAVLRLAER